jgi:hypothetical protein
VFNLLDTKGSSQLAEARNQAFQQMVSIRTAMGLELQSWLYTKFS